MPGKIPVCTEEPSSAPYPSQDWRSCGKVLLCSGKLCRAGKAQGRARLGHSLSTDPLCILVQQPCSKPD